MRKLRLPYSGPHNLEEFCKQIEAYKSAGGEWSVRGIAKNARQINNALQRLADANDLCSRGAVAKALGQPFTRKKQPDISALTLEARTCRESFRNPELHNGKQFPWTPTSLYKHNRDTYNKFMRLGRHWYHSGFSKQKLALVVARLGFPFDKPHTREELRSLMDEYVQQPGANWAINYIKNSTGLAREIYNCLYYFSRKRMPGTGLYATMRRIAARLGHPFQTGIAPCALKRQIERYRKTSNIEWRPTQLLKDAEGSKIYNDVLWIARRRRRETNDARGIKTLAGIIAEELGHPFLPYDHRGRVRTRQPAPEHHKHAWLEEAFNKAWLFAEFEKIHPASQAGRREYAPPYDVKRKRRSVISWAVRLFGSYEKAMEAWQPGSYAESLAQFTPDKFPDEKLEELARNALAPLFQQYCFVARDELRILHPAAYHPLETLRKRKKFEKFSQALEHLGFTPTELSPEEKKAIGYCGELFSLAYYYLRQRAGAEEITEIYPRNPDSPKLEILAPASQKKLIIPDIAHGDGQKILMTESKAGGVFTAHQARRVLEKYRGEFSIKEGEGLPVTFSEVHLHIPKANIEQGVLTPADGKQAIFDRQTPAVRTAEDIAREYARQRAPAELQDNYREFIRAPVRFIKGENNIAGLTRIVSALTPEKFRQQAEEF